MVLAPLIALAVTILLNVGLYVVMGHDPVTVIYAMLLEPFISWSSFSEVLLKTGPLLFIAQGLAIGFRAKIFNIGARDSSFLAPSSPPRSRSGIRRRKAPGSGRPCCSAVP